MHGFMKLHGGEVRVDSRLEAGSTFTVEIPTGTVHLSVEQIVHEENGSATRSISEAFLQEALRWLPAVSDVERQTFDSQIDSIPWKRAVRTYAGRILVADDNADMRQYIRRILQPYYDVQIVPNGEAAIAAIEHTAPDLVLSDVMMPRLDGIAMLKKIRASAHTSTLPVILLTARADEESMVEGMEAGADDYLAKPFSARELLARVRGHIETAKVRRDAAEQLRASQAILSHEVANFETLLRELPVGIAVSFDPECANIRVNPALAEMLGIEESQNASKTGPGSASRISCSAKRNRGEAGTITHAGGGAGKPRDRWFRGRYRAGGRNRTPRTGTRRAPAGYERRSAG